MTGIFLNFTHCLYGPSQMSIRTMFPGFYVILCGPHRDVKSAFSFSYFLKAVFIKEKLFVCGILSTWRCSIVCQPWLLKKTALLVWYNTVNMCIQIAFINDVAGKKQRRWYWTQNGAKIIPLLALHSNLKQGDLVSLLILDVTKECWGKENISIMSELRKRLYIYRFADNVAWSDHRVIAVELVLCHIDK